LKLEIIAEKLVEQGKLLATAESCTGGGLSQVLTSLPGSSQWFDRGFVTYSNAAKQEMLGISAESLAEHGAVSEVVALEMAQGALKNSAADLAVSITGIAGPDGGSEDKPVGMVCFALVSDASEPIVRTEYFQGTRLEVREAAIEFALKYLQDVD
jgi:nicotinamide-nucleotide amidase